jgi:hypothetical protein
MGECWRRSCRWRLRPGHKYIRPGEAKRPPCATHGSSVTRQRSGRRPRACKYFGQQDPVGCALVPWSGRHGATRCGLCQCTRTLMERDRRASWWIPLRRVGRRGPGACGGLQRDRDGAWSADEHRAQQVDAATAKSGNLRRGQGGPEASQVERWLQIGGTRARREGLPIRLRGGCVDAAARCDWVRPPRVKNAAPFGGRQRRSAKRLRNSGSGRQT